MTKIIVDTNIVFSALLNTNSRIGQILVNGKNHFDFYSPAYVKFEIFKLKEKIKSIGKLTDNEFLEIYGLILKNITILNHSIIPTEIYKNAEIIPTGTINIKILIISTNVLFTSPFIIVTTHSRL